jgi:hypothetical protein
MRLDTIPGKMGQAIALCRKLGFIQIAACYPPPVKETLFLELVLHSAADVSARHIAGWQAQISNNPQRVRWNSHVGITHKQWGSV